MLILSRRAGQSFIITIGPELDPTLTVGELFRHGPITVSVSAVIGSRVKLSITADRRLLVLRDELCRENILQRRVGWS